MIIYYYFVWFFIINACNALDYNIIVTAVDFVGSMTPSSVYANVGDRIVFQKNQFSIGNFSIVEADTQGSCVQTTRPNAFTAQLSDTQVEAVLNLATPGIFYFFDAVSQRCSYGSRLVVHVAASSGSTSTSYNQPPIPSGQTNQPLSTNSPLNNNNNNNNNNKSTSNGPSIGIIIGIVGGVLFVLAILITTVVFFIYRNKNNNKDNNNNNTNYNNRSNDYNNNNYSGNYNNNNNFVNSNYNNGSNNYNNGYNNGNNNYNSNYNYTNDDYNSNQHEVLEIPSSDDRNLLTQPR